MSSNTKERRTTNCQMKNIILAMFLTIYIYRFNSQCVALSRKANLGIVIKTVVYRRAHVLITLFVFVCA